jgi:type IV pilus assembly protein PilX
LESVISIIVDHEDKMKKFQYARLRKKQTGVVLFVALIVLVVMTLGGISMMRAADTGTQIAGNLAFRQSALQAAETAFEQAMQKVSLISNSGASTSDNPGLCYTKTYLNVSTPSALPWSTGSCDLGTDSVTGNRVQLMINRLSNDFFQANTLAPSSSSSRGSKKCAGNCNMKGVYEHYRIIARVSDSKGMVTFIEEKIY